MKVSGVDLASVDARTAWVLDIGCGQGWAVLEAASQGARAVGLDLSPELLGKARGHLKNAPEECFASFVLARSDATPLAAQRFDVLICTEVIEHTLKTQAT
jgi:2-polyprenyl-3-methyl-5-hydroxy-6-metoxy-1,4-benzoquinol methylase